MQVLAKSAGTRTTLHADLRTCSRLMRFATPSKSKETFGLVLRLADPKFGKEKEQPEFMGGE